MTTPPPRINPTERADYDTLRLVEQCIAEDVYGGNEPHQHRGPPRAPVDVPREFSDMYVTRKTENGELRHFRLVCFEVAEVGDEPASEGAADCYERAALEIQRNVMARRELLIEAWVAETGLMPSEAETCHQTDAQGVTRFWVQRREDLPSPRDSSAPELTIDEKDIAF